MSRIDSSLWIKICGLMQPTQAVEIAALGASAIGFICVPASPRYVAPQQIQLISDTFMAAGWADVERVGVFADAASSDIHAAVTIGRLTTLQLHGKESPETCAQLRQAYPTLKIIKAFRIRATADLASTAAYEASVDALLLDAYHPQLLGGTGQTLDWESLQAFKPTKPWYLAGGLKPENVQDALRKLTPDGIDVSSGVEVAPGDKSVAKVKELLAAVRSML
ncbi:MAG: phosphoribosylanthranilate isomerase [Cyanobacteria bacterium P01_H01_bin.58]